MGTAAAFRHRARDAARRILLPPRELDALRLQAGTAAVLAARGARPTFRHLWDAEVRVYSQWGEDGILDLLCEAADLPRPRALELGAGDFGECNTRFLAEYRSASVLAADARPDLATHVAGLEVHWRTTVLPRVGWITPGTAPVLFAEAVEAFGGVDLLSLDLDGNDYWVARSLPLGELSVAVVEYNPGLGAGRPVSVPRDDAFERLRAHHSGLYFGASLTAFVELFARHGLVFVGSNRACSNAFFLREDRLADLPLRVPADLGPYLDRRLREGRDGQGRLDFRPAPAHVEQLARLPLVDTVTGERLTVGEVLG